LNPNVEKAGGKKTMGGEGSPLETGAMNPSIDTAIDFL
jgi:hypothetical protein